MPLIPDVCAVLEVGNPTMALRRLDDDEKGLTTIQTPGGPQRVTIINESGLYSLVLTSRKPEAKAFKKWIPDEIWEGLNPHAEQLPGDRGILFRRAFLEWTTE